MTSILPSTADIRESASDARIALLCTWLNHVAPDRISHIEPASSDASFRRYFRLWCGNRHFIAMDAPPPQEQLAPFIRIAKLLKLAGIQAPEILASEASAGFMLLSDLGQTSYLQVLTLQSADQLYEDALQVLLRLQRTIKTPPADLPNYNEALLRRELGIFEEWCVQKLLKHPERPALHAVWQALIASALAQPQGFVHRDFHSRNLMAMPIHNPGVLDFQDAVWGPLSYDLVSLIRDCYIQWPEAMVLKWAKHYHTGLIQHGLLNTQTSWPQFQQWMDWMGLQRHLKAIGIFCRLALRDHKPDYLGDIPRTLGYCLDVTSRYSELAALERVLLDDVQPGLKALGIE